MLRCRCPFSKVYKYERGRKTKIMRKEKRYTINFKMKRTKTNVLNLGQRGRECCKIQFACFFTKDAFVNTFQYVLYKVVTRVKYHHYNVQKALSIDSSVHFIAATLEETQILAMNVWQQNESTLYSLRQKTSFFPAKTRIKRRNVRVNWGLSVYETLTMSKRRTNASPPVVMRKEKL